MPNRSGSQLHALIYSEMAWLGNIWPTNPGDQAAIIRRAKVTNEQLPELAVVVYGFVRTADAGGLAYAWMLWDSYIERFGFKGEPSDSSGSPLPQSQDGGS